MVTCTRSGRHQACSNNTLVVVSEISVEAPPITPAMPTAAPSPSEITPSPALSVRVTSSRVTIVSPSTASRTTSAPPGNLARSYVWLGCPSSNIT